MSVNKVKIKISEDGLIYNGLPYVFSSIAPYFSWEITGNISQSKYLLELKTKEKRLRTDGTYGYGYYASGIVTTKERFHKVSINLDSNTWRGVIEIRLRIYNSNEDIIYSTHDYDSTVDYEFEPYRQYHKWDSEEDALYCVRDIDAGYFNKADELKIGWHNSFDDDDALFSRYMIYEYQICNSPLFDSGAFEVLNGEQSESGGFSTFVNYKIDEFNLPYFFRVRAFDGYDYSDWSDVRGFVPRYNFVPSCEIISVNADIYPRDEGEVLVEYIIHDEDNRFVNVYFEYSYGAKVPDGNPENEDFEKCVFNGASLIVPTNEIISSYWLSAKSISDKAYNDIYIYMRAFDGTDYSAYASYGPIILNNLGIGPGVEGGSIDSIGFYITGKTIDINRYLQIPKERIFQTPDGLEYDFKATLLNHEEFIGIDLYASSVSSLIKKHYYSLYHGYDFYDNTRLSKDLLLNFKNEYKYVVLRGLGYNDSDIRFNRYPYELERLFEEEFTQIYLDQGEWGFESSREGDTYGLMLGLGRENEDVYYDLSPRPDIEPYFNLIRPNVWGGYGLYVDGPGINFDEDDYGKYKKKPSWTDIYKLHSFHCPDVEEKKVFLIKGDEFGDELVTSKLLPYGQRMWHRIGLKITVRFPLIISDSDELKNDMYCFHVNRETEISGSVLSGLDMKVFNYPFEKKKDGGYEYWKKKQDVFDGLVNFFRSWFGGIDIFELIKEENFDFDHEAKTLTLGVFSKKSHKLKTFEIKKIDGSCYDAFGLEEILYNQFYEDVNEGGYGGEYGFKYYSSGDELGFGEEKELLFEMKPESDFHYGFPEGDPNTEPLFTCSLDEVNENGFHFRYTPERYAEHKKVYVRLYHVEPCFPIEDPELGYRNFIVVPHEYKPGVYRRKKIRQRRGLSPETEFVMLENGKMDIAYWGYEDEKAEELSMISHAPIDKDDLSLGYKRNRVRDWLPKICSKNIYIATYVEYEKAFSKPFVESDIWGGNDPINRHSSVNPSSHITSGYNFYLMGAYKPSAEQLDAGMQFLSYDYSSIVSQGQMGDYSRFKKHWESFTLDATKGGCDFIFVEPNLFGFGGKIIIGQSFGYQPDITLEEYFKKTTEKKATEVHMPQNSSYVLDITCHPHLNPRHLGHVIKDYGMLSDANLSKVNPEDFIKRPLIDFRVSGRQDGGMKYYFSGNPRDEHLAYSTRPDIVYREDRPWRINGFIQKLEQIKTWGFKFLQSSWNAYNQIHWHGMQSKYIYAKIEAAKRIEDGVFGEWFDVITKSAVYNDDYGWIIPYNKVSFESDRYDEEKFREGFFPSDWVIKQIIPVDWFGTSTYQSDYIDTINQDEFKFGNSYRFRISSVNVISGVVTTPTTSNTFTLDIDAASPPTIVSMSIDKWTKILTIEFRFDDVNGRLYDLSDFHYSLDEGDTWINEGFDYLSGHLTDLESNTSGDRTHFSNLKTHFITLDLNLLSDVFERPSYVSEYDYEGNLIVRLSAVLSEDKSGLLLPVFSFKMWANEFLKKSEDTIIKIGGQKTRYVYAEGVDENGEPVSMWRYLDKGEEVYMSGDIDIVNDSILKIEEDFASWYSGVRTYYYPGFRSRLDFIYNNEFESKYRLFCFDVFLDSLNLESEYASFVSEFNLGSLGKMRIYLKEFDLVVAYDEFCRRRAVSLSVSFLDSESLFEDFIEWYESRKVTIESDFMYDFIVGKGLLDEYTAYIDGGAHDYIGFLKSKELDGEYLDSYENVDVYHDEISLRRSSFISDNYSSEFNSWLSAPKDIDDNDLIFEYLPFEISDYDDDKRVLFLEWAYNNDVIEADLFEQTVTDEQHSLGWDNFLSQIRHGITLEQRYKDLIAEKMMLIKRLNAAQFEKNYYETRHRARLIKEGFFSNGFLDNLPYNSSLAADDGIAGEGNLKINYAFRFRVETKPTKGNLSKLNQGAEIPNDPNQSSFVPSFGYEDRFNLYFRFQLDFFDTFDSQDGLPLRDIVYQDAKYGVVNSDTYDVDGVLLARIPGGIVAESGIKSTPSHVYESTNPDTGHDMVTTADPYDLRFTGNYSLEKSMLPGRVVGDTLPSYYRDFEQLYYWRVATYNLLSRSVFESSFGKVYDFGGSSGGYTFKFLNKFKSGVKNTCIGDRTNHATNLVRVATSELPSPLWKVDCDGHFSGSYYEWAENFNRDEVWYNSPWVNKSRIHRGEVLFLTDRPRKVEADASGLVVVGDTSYSITYIDDEEDNFLSVWIPYNNRREKPCVLRDDENCEYYMFTHKPMLRKVVNDEIVDGCVITFSRGFSPMCFGEESRCFPFMAHESFDSIIPNALSFENPWVIKDGGIYRMYFNVVFFVNGAYKTSVYCCESHDLSKWEGFKEIPSLEGCTDVMVYVEEGAYKLLCIKGKEYVGSNSINCIYGSVSGSWDIFASPSLVYEDMYHLSRPCFCNERLYFSRVDNGSLLFMNRTGKNENANDEFDTDIPVADANNPQLVLQSNDFRYRYPCVISDVVLGYETERIYFNYDDSPYLWVDGNLSEFGKAGNVFHYQEMTIGTRVLERYVWKSANIRRISAGGIDLPFWEETYEEIYNEDGWYDFIITPYSLPVSQDGVELEIEIDFYGNALGFVRIPINSIDRTIEIESLSEWVDNNNVDTTDAILMPEDVSDDERDNISVADYIIEKEMFDAYVEWRSENPELEFSSENEYMYGFLVHSGFISDYLQRTVRGAGVYRHREALDKLKWTGDGVN